MCAKFILYRGFHWSWIARQQLESMFTSCQMMSFTNTAKHSHRKYKETHLQGLRCQVWQGICAWDGMRCVVSFSTPVEEVRCFPSSCRYFNTVNYSGAGRKGILLTQKRKENTYFMNFSIYRNKLLTVYSSEIIIPSIMTTKGQKTTSEVFLDLSWVLWIS